MQTDHILAPNSEVLARLPGGRLLPAEANAGLLFDRYLPLWDSTTPGTPRRRQLLAPLQEFAASFNAHDAGQAHAWLRSLHQRLERLAQRGHYTRAIYQTVARLATGLGTDHPSGNGFTFDAVLGVPILPGSGIKGLCRQAAQYDALDTARVTALFGPPVLEGQDAPGYQGDLVFLDAYPSHWPRLCVDVINSHHPQYYQRLETTEEARAMPLPSPSETESPVPVFFLAVDQGVRFTFWLGSLSNNQDNLQQGLALLESGLQWLGFGAKTAVGYGVMHKVVEP